MECGSAPEQRTTQSDEMQIKGMVNTVNADSSGSLHKYMDHAQSCWWSKNFAQTHQLYPLWRQLWETEVFMVSLLLRFGQRTMGHLLALLSLCPP